MHLSDKGLMALISHEGVVQSRYKDSVGVWTIGVVIPPLSWYRQFMEKPLTKIIQSVTAKANLEARFWPKVNKKTVSGCWEWISAARHPFGYGRMTAGRGVNLKAHQIAWALENGTIPDGAFVCHSCDNPSCCNHNHLFLGSQKDNMGDAKAKGRMSKPPLHKGETHPKSKLTNAEVVAIIADKSSAKLLAAKYGVTAKTIYCIKRGERSFGDGACNG